MWTNTIIETVSAIITDIFIVCFFGKLTKTTIHK